MQYMHLKFAPILFKAFSPTNTLCILQKLSNLFFTHRFWKARGLGTKFLSIDGIYLSRERTLPFFIFMIFRIYLAFILYLVSDSMYWVIPFCRSLYFALELGNRRQFFPWTNKLSSWNFVFYIEQIWAISTSGDVLYNWDALLTYYDKTASKDV